MQLLKTYILLALMLSLYISAKPQKTLIGDFYYPAERGFRGEKLVRTNGTLTKHIAYIYDGNLVSAEVNVLNGQQKLIRKYTWGLDPAGTRQEVGGIGALVGMEFFDENGESNKFHMISDAGGNVVNVIHSKDDGTLGVANSYEYGPFGQVIAKSEAVESPYGYQTKMFDVETGLGYWGNRSLDVVNGRWLNRDPIGIKGGINEYNYLSNNGVNAYTGSSGFVRGMSYSVGQYRKSSTWVDPWGHVMGPDFDGNGNVQPRNNGNHNGLGYAQSWWINSLFYNHWITKLMVFHYAEGNGKDFILSEAMMIILGTEINLFKDTKSVVDTLSKAKNLPQEKELKRHGGEYVPAQWSGTLGMYNASYTGTMTYCDNRNWDFEGYIEILDRYDFNASDHRPIQAEITVALARWFFVGKDYNVKSTKAKIKFGIKNGRKFQEGIDIGKDGRDPKRNDPYRGSKSTFSLIENGG